MRRADQVRAELRQFGFSSAGRNQFRCAAAVDGLEYGVELDVFSDSGLARIKITVGVWHPVVRSTVVDVLTALGETALVVRIARTGFCWLLANEHMTTDIVWHRSDTSAAVALRDMLGNVAQIQSLESAVLAFNPGHWAWRNWVLRTGSRAINLLGAIELLQARGSLSSFDYQRELAFGLIARDARYGRVGGERITSLVRAAVQRQAG